MICSDLDPFDNTTCDFTATWLMTSDVELYERATLCARHKQINEMLFAKYYPHAHVSFVRINDNGDPMTIPNATESVPPPKLFTIPAGTKQTHCSKCRAPIYFVGKQPLRALATCHYLAKNVIIATPDAVPPTRTTDGRGFSHYIDCPNADAFRGRK